MALLNGEIDVKDAYTTDAKIDENDLVVLTDDLKFFPQYQRGIPLSARYSAPRNRTPSGASKAPWTKQR